MFLQAAGPGAALAIGVGVVALAGHSSYLPGYGNHSAYSRPTPALGGPSLAAYVAEHERSRIVAGTR